MGASQATVSAGWMPHVWVPSNRWARGRSGVVRGVGREIILEGLRRLKSKGVQRARVSTAGFNAPAQRLYESCGFERIDTARTYIKRIS